MDIHCFGDSHARFFRKANTLAWAGVVSHTSPRVVAFDYVAASAKGFAAGEASRFAYKRFRRDYEMTEPDFVCLGFGQVDAEVGFYFRKHVRGFTGSAEADLSSVYDAYIRMAESAIRVRPLVFKGPNPSTLRIDTQLQRYVSQRLVVRMTRESERAAILADLQARPPEVAEHGRINSLAAELLRASAEAAGHVYFDVRAELEDPQSIGMARWEHVPADSDVHLCDSFHVRRAHAERLNAAFEGIASRRLAN